MSIFLAVSGIIGTLVGIAGFAFAVAESRRVGRLRSHRQDVLRWAIDRANHVKVEHEIIDELIDRNRDLLLARWLWLTHQVGSDMYMSLIDEYLAGEKRFTYADLEKIAHTNIVGGGWQYRYWISKLALRPENRNQDPPSMPQFTRYRVERHQELRQREAKVSSQD